MKRITFVISGILSLLTIASCTWFYSDVQLSGDAPASMNGVIAINDANNKPVFNTNVTNGKFSFRKQPIKYNGFYKLVLTGADNKPLFENEIYLEPGDYTIHFTDLHQYPQIKSMSVNQNELSQYQHFQDSIQPAVMTEARTLVMNKKTRKALPKTAYGVAPFVYAKTTILNKFIDKYPHNSVVAHMMANEPFDVDPVSYNKVFQRFNASAKNTADGMAIDSTLTALLKLLPGQPAPVIQGKNPEGKQVSIQKTDKKYTLVAFWTATSSICQQDNDMITNDAMQRYGKYLGVIGVCVDTSRNWWLSGIKQYHLNWTNINDFKGFDSPNVNNYAIKYIPTYFLLDSQGHIITRSETPDIVINTFTALHIAPDKTAKGNIVGAMMH